MSATLVRFPSGDLTLEGVLHLPEGGGPFPAVVMCHPHPRYGGDMHNNVVMAAVTGLTARSIATLRFNFRGSGGSGGSHSGGADEAGDVRAALDYLAGRQEVDAARLGLGGYSFGAAMALRAAAGAHLTGLALVSLPPALAPNTVAALASAGCPVLLLTGDADSFCPLEELEAIAEEAGGHVTLHAVDETDHFWWGRDATLAGAIGGFFAEREPWAGA